MIRRVWSEHRLFVGVLVVFIVLASAYSISTPLFEAPDEQWHFAFVQYIAQRHELPVQHPGQPDHLARQEASQPPLYYVIAAAATFWIDTSDFPGIAWENPHYGFSVPGVVNDNKNLFIHTSQESFPWHNTALAVHLARFLSVFFGALAVTFSYLLALEIFEGDKIFASASAAFVAFLPQFLFISGAVSNDSAIVAMCAWALWLIVLRLGANARPSGQNDIGLVPLWPLDSITLGVVAGLAALAKVSGLGIGILAVLALLLVCRMNIRGLVTHLALFTISFLIIAGWWYARNLFLYGELTGTEMMLSIFGARVTPLTIPQFTAQLGEVWETFWIGFGWGNIRAPYGIYLIFSLHLGLAGLGWIRTSIHPVARSGIRRRGFRLALCLAWIVIVSAAFLRWMLLTQAPHGRLLFPALPALAALVVFGWTQIAPQIRLAASLIPATALGTVALIALIAILRPAYAFPSVLSNDAAAKIGNRVDITYDGKMQLLGYGVSPLRPLPDGSVTLDLFWRSLAVMNEDYSIGISVLDSENHVVSQRNSYPGHGMLPTSLWRAGQMIKDQYWVPIPAGAPAPSVAQIQISLFDRATQKELSAFDPKGNPITPIVGQFKIKSPVPITVRSPVTRTDYVFENQITLVGYDVDASQVVLYWKGTPPIQHNYTIFAHWLDASGHIVAQMDAKPSIPTSLWDDGDTIVERFERSSDRLRVGLYLADTGERLSVGQEDSVILVLPAGQ